MPKAMKRINTDGLPFAIYCRLSRKKPTRRRGGRKVSETETVERQERELRAYAAQQGYPVADHLIFVDPNASAWKRKGAVRPAWQAMMAAAERGEIAGILVYRLDRFARAPRDGEDLLDLAEDRGLIIDGVKSGKINLRTAAGRKQFRDMVNAAAAESDLISERSREALAEIMLDGKPMGSGRAFGFETGGEDQRPAEVEIIREMASRVLGGESLAKLAADLNTRVDAEGNPLLTTRGFKWSGRSLGRMLGRRRYGGFVEHHGEVVATMPGEPVLDHDTYTELRALLRSRLRGRTSSQSEFLLTGFVFCGKCGATMNGATRNRPLADGTKQREYRCMSHMGGCGGVTVVADPVEEKVDRHMIALLSDPENQARVSAEGKQLNEARAGQESKLERVDKRLRALRWKYNHTLEMDEDEYAELERGLLAMKAELEAQVQATAAAVAMGATGKEDWRGPGMTPERKRLAIRRHKVRVTINPGRPGGNFDRERVKIT